MSVRLLIIGTMGGPMGQAARFAAQRGAVVECVSHPDAAIAHLRQGAGADLAFMDMRLEITRLVSRLDAESLHLPIVACGAALTSSGAARKLIEAGAVDYLALPPKPEMVLSLLETFHQSDQGSSLPLIYDDPASRATIRMVEKIAPSSASILISGASGTGKEQLARLIHAKSPRSQQPFIALNCAAIPENLLESELFGHEKGAFSGAIARRIGKFEQANGGTLLLDEISEMEFRLQAKLLRALQERQIDRVGGSGPVAIDVRILATSNRDMASWIAAGKFREDLYFRLNVVNIHLADLRDRPRDIPTLARHFIKKYSAENQCDICDISASALKILAQHSWPGNVRELENVIHRAVLLSETPMIDPKSIMLDKPFNASRDAFQPRPLAEVERDHILQTLDHCAGDHKGAAHLLGIPVKMLQDRLVGFSRYGCA
ncbi:MAG: sigma-54 dependent transcriptional regulator [Pseudomonadota bacterium]